MISAAKILNQGQIKAAKDFLASKCFTEECVKYLNSCTDFEIEILIRFTFEGGIEGFLADYKENLCQ